MNIGKLLLRIFAAIGVILMVTMIAGGFSTWYWLTRPVPQPAAPENMVIQIDLSDPIVEQSRSMPFSLSMLMQTREETELIDIIRALDRAKSDPRVKGLVARIGAEHPSLVHTQEIRAALKRFREAGKFSYVFSASYGNFGSGNRSYYLASGFENIWLQPAGTVGISGLGMEVPFGRKALKKIGVEADFMRREEYKSVMENFTRDGFSPAVRANMESLVGNFADQIAAGIAEGRKVSIEKARKWMAEGPYTAEEALNEGLVTRIGYADEMMDVVRTLATEPAAKDGKPRPDPVLVSVNEYLAYSHKKTEPKATVAYISGIGLITDVKPGPSNFADDNLIDTERLINAFGDAADDPDVKAILFRIDSPGGSPNAAESIRRALVKAQRAKKPVFVSMGETAASGGYWIAMNADRIIAGPGTITGSIGVVAGKFIAGELMEKLGISWDGIATEENAKMWSLVRPFDARARERMNALLDATYASFIRNVAEARKIPIDKMSDIAKGRVWTGEQAVKNCLVDELGGYAETIAAIKKHLKLDPGDVITLQQFPAPETPVTLALKLLQRLGLEGAATRAVPELMQGVKSALGPYMYDLLDRSVVSARIPSVFLGAAM